MNELSCLDDNSAAPIVCVDFLKRFDELFAVN